MTHAVLPIKITYRFDEPRFMRACHALWAHRAIGRRGNLWLGGSMAAAGTALMLSGLTGWPPWTWIVGGALIAALDLVRDTLWRRGFRRSAKYNAPITAILSEEGVGVRQSEGDNHLPWSHFNHHLITRDHLFLIIDQRHFSIIPREAFSSAQQRDAAEALVARHLPPLARRWF